MTRRVAGSAALQDSPFGSVRRLAVFSADFPFLRAAGSRVANCCLPAGAECTSAIGHWSESLHFGSGGWCDSLHAVRPGGAIRSTHAAGVTSQENIFQSKYRHFLAFFVF